SEVAHERRRVRLERREARGGGAAQRGGEEMHGGHGSHRRGFLRTNATMQAHRSSLRNDGEGPVDLPWINAPGSRCNRSVRRRNEANASPRPPTCSRRSAASAETWSAAPLIAAPVSRTAAPVPARSASSIARSS